jgi:hypothetical protein
MHKSTGSNHPSGMPECITGIRDFVLWKKHSAIRSHASSSIAITNIKKTENPNYLFVTINTKDVAATEILFRLKQ